MYTMIEYSWFKLAVTLIKKVVINKTQHSPVLLSSWYIDWPVAHAGGSYGQVQVGPPARPPLSHLVPGKGHQPPQAP